MTSTPRFLTSEATQEQHQLFTDAEDMCFDAIQHRIAELHQQILTCPSRQYRRILDQFYNVIATRTDFEHGWYSKHQFRYWLAQSRKWS